MTLGGLWHGISWMFVVWGVFHGVWLIAHRGFKAICDRQPWLDWLLTSGPGTALRMATTFLLVCVGWVFFYAASLEAEQSLKVANDNVAKGGRVERVTCSAWNTSWPSFTGWWSHIAGWDRHCITAACGTPLRSSS
jgi:D-alanyl-lipoteichoic acid acyltransferase DltB (MBOAT superfamily)